MCKFQCTEGEGLKPRRNGDTYMRHKSHETQTKVLVWTGIHRLHVTAIPNEQGKLCIQMKKSNIYDDLAENREAQRNDHHRNSCLDTPSYAFSVSE